jgi:AbrB family looped-hinge helix DNA binding protein
MRGFEMIGIIKEFDKLGRIVIPKELRERYGFFDKVEIVATENGILIQNPRYVLTERKNDTIQ